MKSLSDPCNAVPDAAGGVGEATKANSENVAATALPSAIKPLQQPNGRSAESPTSAETGSPATKKPNYWKGKKRGPMPEKQRRNILQSRLYNRMKSHRARLAALHVYDIMTRVYRGDFN